MKVGNGSDILYSNLEFVSKCNTKKEFKPTERDSNRSCSHEMK